ncbi:hypothetical protein [Peribacillus simplex]|uniref:hypothetical protein n=1 Tax=Peribacillus simplex TaxID=1478 RepID=UPI003CF510F3
MRFKTLLRQMKDSRGLFTFNEQLKAILDEVDKSSFASEMARFSINRVEPINRSNIRGLRRFGQAK